MEILNNLTIYLNEIFLWGGWPAIGVIAGIISGLISRLFKMIPLLQRNISIPVWVVAATTFVVAFIALGYVFKNNVPNDSEVNKDQLFKRINFLEEKKLFPKQKQLKDQILEKTRSDLEKSVPVDTIALAQALAIVNRHLNTLLVHEATLEEIDNESQRQMREIKNGIEEIEIIIE